MRFASPEMLNLLWLLVPLYFFMRWAWKARIRALHRFASPALAERLTTGISRGKQKAKLVILFGVFVLSLTALARPLWGVKEQTLVSEGNDIFFLLDVSRSMLAEDIKPNRLERAKFEVGKLIERMQGHRVGVVIFAGEAFVQCPLTLDYTAANILLNEVNTESVPVGGTAISRAVDQAIESFPPGTEDSRVIILITDGEDTTGNPVQAAQRAKEAGVLLYTIGIGDPVGVPIPLRDEEGNLDGYVKDSEGNIHTTKLNLDDLRQMASATNGMFYPVQQADFGLNEIYNHMEQRRQQRLLETQFQNQYAERYYFFLIPAVLLLLIEMLLSDRKSGLDAWKRYLGKEQPPQSGNSTQAI